MADSRRAEIARGKRVSVKQKEQPGASSSAQPGRPQQGPPRAPRPGGPPPPPPPAQAYQGPDRKILPPRWVDFESMDRANDMLHHLFLNQGWVDFMSRHREYYPDLVQEFYGNLVKEDTMLVTRVRGTRIRITQALLSLVLNMPSTGKEYKVDIFNEGEADQAITCDDPGLVDRFHRSAMNINRSPPFQRIIHHMITTIIYPKGGSRNEITWVHKFIFHCLFTPNQANLPHLMLHLLDDVRTHANRSLPFAAHLTAIFRFKHIRLVGEDRLSVIDANVYNLENIKRFMKIDVDEDGEFIRVGRAQDVQEAQENEEEIEDEQEAGHQQNVDAMDEDPAQGEQQAPPPPDVDQEEGAPTLATLRANHITLGHMMDAFRAETFNSLEALDDRVLTVEHNVTTRINTLEQRMDEMHISHQGHFDTQAQMLSEILGYLRPPSDQPPPQ